MLRRLRWGVWSVIALGVAGAFLPGRWAWAAGFVGGCAYGFWLYVRDAVPRHIEQWLDGAAGERWTERQLLPLEQEGWHIAHDLQGRFGNVDHLAVGPRGVFLIDSKNWFGEVTVSNGVATVTPRDNPDAAWTATGLARRMRGMSKGNKDGFQALTGVRTWVQPVVCVWAPFEQRFVQSDGIVYVAGEQLADCLRSWKGSLEPATIDKLARSLGS